MMKFKIYILVIFLFCLGSAYAFQFNGTVYDVNGVALNNSVINITIRNSDFSISGYNFTTANASGWFNLTVSEISNGFYEPKITWRNATSNAIEWVGQTLPSFPQIMLTQVAGTSFYLKQAGTINITSINSSAARISFKYQIKDQKLGYSIADNFASSSVSEANIVVPRARNYSIMIYPDQSMPVSYNWNNFSATQDYDVNSLSRYNFTRKTLSYQFNTTMNIIRLTGYINYSGINGWNTFTVVPYLLEPGNMVHANFGDMPYNISGFLGGTDSHNLTSGFYNISLPSTPAETSSILLFATARNGTGYYGSFRNLTNVASNLNQFNFSAMTGLFGSPANISMEDTTGGQVNITTAKQVFNIVNSTNASLNEANVHAEITLDYSALGLEVGEFTWMVDSGQGSAAQLSIPLLNRTGVKEINIFAGGGDYAPKRLAPTAAQITSNTIANLYNVTLSSFDPGDISGTLSNSNIFMGLTFSNSTCSVPLGTDFPASCFITGLGGNQTTLDNFNPMQAVMGGATLNFIMGKTDSSSNLDLGIIYVNVDMLASGPPDAAFDSSVSESSGTGFSGAARFGSGGPTIYDYVLVGLPYSTSAGSGLNENGNVNISLPNFYDDNWNLIWNVTSNGSNAGALGGNFSHYSARQSEWSHLLNGTVCHTNSSSINVTNPCYIDRSNDMVWVRLPHFSGTGPQIGGSVLAATTTTSSSSSGESGGNTQSSFWTNTLSEDDVELGEKDLLIKDLAVKHRVLVKIGGEQHTVGIIGLTATTATINVSSTPQQKTLSIGEEWKVDVNSNSVYDILIRLNSIRDGRASVSMQSISEQSQEQEGESNDSQTSETEGNRSWWIMVVIIAVIALALAYRFRHKLRR